MLSQLKMHAIISCICLVKMWFVQNCMQAGTGQGQLILFARPEIANSVNIGDSVINSEPVVKILAGSIDRSLHFKQSH